MRGEVSALADDLLDQVFAGGVVGVGLAGEDELERAVLLGDVFEAVEVG